MFERQMAWLATRLVDYVRLVRTYLPDSLPDHWAPGVILAFTLISVAAGVRLRRFLLNEASLPVHCVRFVGSLLAVFAIALWALPVLAVGSLLLLVWVRWDSVGHQYFEWMLFWWRTFENATVVGAGVGLVGAFAVWFLLGRYVESRLSAALNAQTRKATSVDGLTDIRHIYAVSKPVKAFDPQAYFNVRRGLFLGLEEGCKRKPVYLDWSKVRKRHMQFVAPTGFGKGVQLCSYSAQCIRAGFGVVFFDPKDDEFAPHVLRDQCASAGVPFRLIDLRAEVAQINPLANLDRRDVATLLNGVFELKNSGGVADFYRADDREAVHQVTQAVEPMSLPDMYAQVFDLLGEEGVKKATNFLSLLGEAVRLPSVQTRYGEDLIDVIRDGGCLYVIGEDSPEVEVVQRMVFLSTVLLIARRDRDERARHISIILDEFTSWITSPALAALGRVRDKNCNVLIAHQSINNLYEVPQNIDPNAVRGAVVTNTVHKLIGNAPDPETAEWASKLTSKILIERERKGLVRNAELSESFEENRSVIQEQRALIDENRFQALQENEFAFVGGGLSRIVHTAPIKTSKGPLQLRSRLRVEPGNPRSLDLPTSPSSADAESKSAGSLI